MYKVNQESDEFSRCPNRKSVVCPLSYSPSRIKMVYPDTFEGFMVTSHEEWTKFQKQEVFRPDPMLKPFH